MDEDYAEVSDFLKSKGPVLNSFKREYEDLAKNFDNLTNTILERERDVEIQSTDLSSLHEQYNISRHNITESHSLRGAVAGSIANIEQKRKQLNATESYFRSNIASLTNDFEELKKALACGADWKPDQLLVKENLEIERNALTRQLENELAQVGGLRSDVDRVFNIIQELEKEFALMDKKSEETEKKTKEFDNDIKELYRKKEALDKRIFDLQALLVTAEASAIEASRSLKSENKLLAELESSLTSSKSRMEGYVIEYENLLKTLQEVTNELDCQRSVNKKADIENKEKERFIGEKENDIRVFSKEIEKLNQLKEVCKKKIDEVDKEKLATENERDELNNKISHMREVEIKQARKEYESLSKNMVNLKQELDVLRKKEVTTDNAAKQISELMQMHKNTKRNLGVERKIIEDEIKLQLEQIQTLLAEKDKLEREAEFTNQQYYTALEELKLQEMQIKELQKKVAEDQAKLKYKQNLFESVRSDRNLRSQQLVEAQDEISSLKRTFKSMNHHIDQLQEEIASKDYVIVKEHFLHHSVDKDKELLKNEITKIKKQVQSSEQIIENQRVEILKLSRIIEEADEERQRQKNELATIAAEKNLLTAQLVKRNYELNNMYDKIKIQRSNLRIGESQFSKIMEDVADWQQELVTMVQDHHGTVTAFQGIEDLRRTLATLDKEYRRESTKARALGDELDRPMNVHRWRVLESSDPKRYEKICVIQSLQSELISKADEVVNHDLLIQEKEKVYVELKNIIARQPGPEVEEQILVYQQTYKEKSKQLDAMDDELGMYRQQVQIFKDSIAMLDSDMNKVKKRWMKTRRLQDSGVRASLNLN